MTADIMDIHAIKKNEEVQNNPLLITFEDVELKVPYLGDNVDHLEKKIKQLEITLNSIQKSVNQLSIDKYITDKDAEKLISDFISQKKKEGIKEIDVLDIADFLRLPFSQINRIMEKLKSRGLKEV